MYMTRSLRAVGALAAVAVAGCSSLDIANPNAPDAKRALSDPAALEAVAGVRSVRGSTRMMAAKATAC